MKWWLGVLGIVFNVVLFTYVFLWFKRLSELKTVKFWTNLSKIKSTILLISGGLGLLSILILLRPNLGVEQAVQGALEANIAYMFIVDTSASMAARDIEGQSRLDFAKKFIHQVLDVYPAYSSLILFTEMPRLTLPFTFDSSTLLTFADALEPEFPTYAKGSDIVGALKFGAKYLSAASKKLGKPIKPFVFLLTDGECVKANCSTFTFPADAYKEFIVIGIGTKEGANIEFTIGEGSYAKKYLVQDPDTFQPVVTKLDEEYLQALAAGNANGKYYSWKEANTAIEEIQKAYKVELKKAMKGKMVVKREVYPFLMFVFVVLFILFWFDIFIYELYYRVKI